MTWKYADSERPKGKCYDCKRPYSSFLDMTIPDEVWEQINPTHHKGAGLLCPSCIADRIAIAIPYYEMPIKCEIH